jgi:hypothetical protein
MYSRLKAIYWIVRFKKEKKDFEAAAKFYEQYMSAGEEKDKAIGASLMSAEQSQDKYKAAVRVLLK